MLIISINVFRIINRLLQRRPSVEEFVADFEKGKYPYKTLVEACPRTDCQSLILQDHSSVS